MPNAPKPGADRQRQTSAPPPAASDARPIWRGLRIVSLLTLASRVLGLVRDMAMAALFGNGAVLDAFTVAFRLPNLARRLFGEGALTAAFLPAFIRQLEHAGRDSAWKLASAVLNSLAVTLCLLVLAGELILGGLAWVFRDSGDGRLLIGLAAVLLPYLVLICLAAQISAVLHALGRFAAPAMMPALLNIVWIAAIFLLAPAFRSQTAQIYAIAGAIVLGGVLQLLVLVPALAGIGFRYRFGWRSAREKVRAIGRAMLPVLLGLSVTQLNTLSDSLIAWGFSQPAAERGKGRAAERQRGRFGTMHTARDTKPPRDPRLSVSLSPSLSFSPPRPLSVKAVSKPLKSAPAGGIAETHRQNVVGISGIPRRQRIRPAGVLPVLKPARADTSRWRLDTGTAAALYFGQRLYQFPLGIFGVALGTVLFPLLSRHAEQGRLDLLRQDLGLGLRLVIAIGLPAGVGLMLLARPLTMLLFQRGAFDLHDSEQTTEMIAAYGAGVWAYCGLLIVHRGYYAVGDRLTPLRVGLCAVALNLVLNFALLWLFGGAGLALATSIAATVQLLAAGWFLQYRVGFLPWRELRLTLWRAVAATAVMAAVCWWTLAAAPSGGDLSGRLLRVFAPLGVAVAVYFALARLLGLHEVWLLLRRERRPSR